MPLQASKVAALAAPAELNLVPALERAVQLLDLLAEQDQALSLAQIQKALGWPKSSLHGLLRTLVHVGLLQKLSDQSYRLGAKSLQWADAFNHQSRILGAFYEACQSQKALRDETVMLAVLDLSVAAQASGQPAPPQVHYLACRAGSKPLAVNFRVGGRFPAVVTSSGKAMLASLPRERVKALLSQAHSFPKLTRYSITSFNTLSKQLDAIARQGYAVDDEETAEGMHCFGAPIFVPGKAEAEAAVAVSLIKAQTSPKRRQEVIKQIGALAKTISEHLG